MSWTNLQWRRGRIQRGSAYAVLAVAAAICLMPFGWMVLTSVKPEAEIFRTPPTWLPGQWMWGNYVDAWQAGGLDFGRLFTNTFLITVPVTISTVLVSSLAAYVFARMRFRGRNFWFGLFVASLMIPDAPRIIPSFLLFRELGWLDSWLPLMVPGMLGNAFAIFLMRQFFRTLPTELDQAATVDGASRFRIWWQIYLPLSRPAALTVAIFSFNTVYNDFLGPLVYLNSPEKFTVQLGLATFNGTYGTRYDLMMAAATFTLLPMVVLFFAGQRHFTQGIALTGTAGR